MQLDQLTTPSGTTLQGPLLITPPAFGDDRGWFYESWNQRKFDEAVGESVLFSQDNHSRSIQGASGIAPARPRTSGCWCATGAIYDAVDIRRGSPTSAPGLALNSVLRTRHSSGFQKALPMAFLPQQRC